MADLSDVLDTMIAEGIGEGPEGMRRIAETIINRSAIRGLSLGDVVRQPRQYTGFEHPGPAAVAAQHDPRAQAAARAALELALQPGDPTNGADHYLNPKQANPSWASSMPSTGTYQNHQFFASRPVQQEALARLLTSSAPTPFSPPSRTNVPTDLIAQSLSNNSAAQARSQIAGMFGPAVNANTPRLTDGTVRSPASGLTGWVNDIFPNTARPAAPITSQTSLTDAGAIQNTIGALKQDEGAGAALARLLGRDTTQTAVGGPLTTRSVTSVRMPALTSPRMDTVEIMPGFADLQSAFSAPSVTRTASPLAGSVQMAAGVRPQVPSTQPAPGMDPVETMPAFGDMASMFGNEARIPGPNGSTVANKNQDRLAPTTGNYFGSATIPAIRTITEEVPNPAWAAWDKMDNPGTMPTWGQFTDAFATKKPEPPKTITVTRQVPVAKTKPVVARPATQPLRIEVSGATTRPAPRPAAQTVVQQLQATGLSASKAYDLANAAAQARAAAGGKYGDGAGSGGAGSYFDRVKNGDNASGGGGGGGGVEPRGTIW